MAKRQQRTEVTTTWSDPPLQSFAMMQPIEHLGDKKTQAHAGMDCVSIASKAPQLPWLAFDYLCGFVLNRNWNEKKHTTAGIR
jgi:hypothetical protein